jgi:hypothetical protein
MIMLLGSCMSMYLGGSVSGVTYLSTTKLKRKRKKANSPNIQDGNGSVILALMKIQIFLEGVEFCLPASS